MRRVTVLVTCFVFFAFFGLMISFVTGTAAYEEGEDLCLPTGAFLIEAPEGVEAKKGGVDFPHSLHFGYNCKVCHHKWEYNAEIKTCGATGCHDQIKPVEKAAPDSVEAIGYYKYAYHELCIGCHKDIKIQNKKLAASTSTSGESAQKTGPTGCVRCHLEK